MRRLLLILLTTLAAAPAWLLAQPPQPVLPPRVNGAAPPGVRRPSDPQVVFMQACSRDPWETLAEMIAQGADPRADDAFGRSPLREAVANRDVRVVPKLIAAGAKPNAAAMS